MGGPGLRGGPFVASRTDTTDCRYQAGALESSNLLLLMQTQKWVPSLADTRAPTPLRRQNEHGKSCTGTSPRLSNVSMRFLLGSHEMSLFYQVPHIVLPP